MFYEDAFEERVTNSTSSETVTTSAPKTLSFIYDWVITTPPSEQARMPLSTHFSTTYNLGTTDWNVHLKHRTMFNSFMRDRTRNDQPANGSHLIVETARSAKMLAGRCWIQYAMYSDEEMAIKTYESEKIAAVGTETFLNEGLRFRTPMTDRFFDHFAQAYKTQPGYKLHVNIELNLDVNYFNHGFESSSIFLSRTMKSFPIDIDTNFLFTFLKNSNFTINCSDGKQVVADKRSIYLTSAYFRGLPNIDTATEVSVDFESDVVRPVIWYLHTYCFELPKDYSLSYVRMLMRFVEIINPSNKLDVQACIHRSLCLKAAANVDNYTLMLELAQLSAPARMMELKQIVCTVIADQYYERFKHDFPDGIINILRDGPAEDLVQGLPFIGQTPSDWIDRMYRGKFRTTLVIP